MKKTKYAYSHFAVILSSVAFMPISLYSQGGPPPPPDRGHTANTIRPLELVPATEEPPAESQISITTEDDKRIITSNIVPKHKIGKFPNTENPNTPTEQTFKIELPLSPKANAKPTRARTAVGIFLNGVLMEAGTGEFWFGKNKRKPWNYTALGNAVAFGLDANHAHVQPGGKYHYHGQPTGYLAQFDISEDKHSPLVGWAFDGFPIYALYGYKDGKDSEIILHKSSYQLKKGKRPELPDGPGGAYDGTFGEDYKYVKGSGTLDECNGRFTVTPEFPDGTYAYFLTPEWPVILHNFRGTPVHQKGRRRGGRAGQPRETK